MLGPDWCKATPRRESNIKMMKCVVALLLAQPALARFSQRHISGGDRRRVRHDHSLNLMDQQLDNLKKKGSVTSGSSAGVDSAASTHFFDDAVLDHFSSSFAAPSQKWSQRYYVDSTFWKGEGYPVFLYIGGEGPQSAPSSRLFMWSLAEEHGALMLSLEHRFYGESQPTADMSVTNLAFLTSEQALADANRFIEYVKGATADDIQSTPALVLPSSASSSKVVAFGGSYPGNLATWIKLKYPASVVGSVGSSAPVFANYDYVQYAEVVGAALAYDTIGGSSECEATVAEGVAQLMALVNLTAPTWGTSDDIPEALKPCAGMDNLLDLSTYQSELFGNFQGMVQYNLMAYKPFVSDLCDTINEATSQGSSALEAFAAASSLFYNESAPFEDRCIASSFQTDYVDFLTVEAFDPIGCNLTCSADRQWIWQSCNEFGYFQTTVSPAASASGNPFSAFSAVNIANAGTAVCEAAFGVSAYQGPVADSDGVSLSANSHYGARHVEGVNITMPNGSMDPWHALSVVNASDPFYEDGSGSDVEEEDPFVRQQTSKGVTVVEIDGTGHCRDMYAPGVFEDSGVPDTAAVQWAHAAIAEQVAKYIGA